ncbi:MAG: ABC transporter ATP-binding protein [Kiritimatiellia bacterium]
MNDPDSPAGAKSPAIEIHEVSKRFGETVALKKLTLTVAAGEIFCFLGPNGAGKTTTIKILTGLLRPDEGHVRICGLDLQRSALEAKRFMGYIPDKPFLYDRLTVTEFLTFTGELYRMEAHSIEQKMEEYLSLFGLAEHRQTLIKNLSHGMQQRLTYAATLLHEPSVLLVDEPLVGLDPRTIRLVKELFRNRARQGTTIFVATHILALAEEIADRIGIVAAGTLREIGSLAQLLQRHGVTNLEDLFLKLTGEPRTALPGEKNHVRDDRTRT